ncbi:DUF2341 domain-containing protein [Candidatus Roizmanbacteria bacterium]|nr:DUF2341 domain-containing protein [Candidatus Roizmanbacteria bacterium]
MKKLWDWYIEGIEKGIYSSFRLARNLGVKIINNDSRRTSSRTVWCRTSFAGMTNRGHSGSPGHRFVSTLSFRLRPESLLKGLLRQSPCSFLAMTKRRPFLFASFGIIILLLPLLFLVLKYRPFSAQAGWFNDNWSYRQTVSLVNTGSAQTDFQVMIATDSASMINAGRLKNDCSDIRITDLNGKKLPYWVEPNTCNTAQTKIWTKVPSIPASTGTATSSSVFMYYGNPNATTESNSKNVFIREISNVAGAWNMDESSWNGTAGEVKDSSGNGNNGQAIGVSAVSVGTSTGGNTNITLCDTGKTWVVNSYANATVTLTSGAYSGQTRIISSNTATCLTVSSAFGGVPNTDSYKITPSTTAGLFGTAGVFDGTSGYVTVPNSSVYQPGLGDFTVSTWLFYTANDSNTHNIFGNLHTSNCTGGANTGCWQSSLSNNLGSVNLNLGSSTNSLSPNNINLSSAPSIGTWHQITWVFNRNSNLLVYVDNQLSITQNMSYLSGVNLSNSYALVLGSRGGGFAPWYGKLSQMRIYKKVLSPSEISDLYGTGGDRLGYTTPNYPGKELVRKYSSAVSYNLSGVETGGSAPIAYWKFDEGQGTVVNSVPSGKTTIINLITNPSIETNTTGWNSDVGISSIVRDNYQVVVGSYALKTQVIQGSGNADVRSDEMPVSPSTNYAASAWFRTDAADFQTAWVSIQWFDASHALISTTTGSSLARSAYSYSFQLFVTGKSPSNAAYARLALNMAQLSTGNSNYWWDRIEFDTAPSPSMYCDGGSSNAVTQASWNGTAHNSTSKCIVNSPNGFFEGTGSWLTEDQCISGKCLQFTDHYADVTVANPWNSSLNIGTSDFTISSWFKLSQPQSAGYGMFGRYPHNTAYNGNFVIGISDNKTTLFFNYRDFAGVMHSYSIPNFPYFGQWTYIEYVKAGNILTLYLNGKQTQQWSISGYSMDINFEGNNYYIGHTGWAPGTITNFTVDEHKIFRYARTPDQIKADYNAGKGKAGMAKGANAVLGSNNKQGDSLSQGLVGYWKMDESSWNGTSGEVKDSSGNNNNGTAQGITGTSTSTGNSSTIVCDSAKTWTVNAFANDTLTLTSGTYSGQTRTIASNTATCITVSTAFGGTPGSDGYKITPSTVGGKFGNGGNFDGSSGFVSVPTSSSFNNFGTNDFTVSVWVKPSVTTPMSVIENGACGNYCAGWELSLTNNNYIVYRIGNASGSPYQTTSGRLTTGIFNHYVISRKNSVLYTYLNGSLLGADNNIGVSSNVSNNSLIYIGSGVWGKMNGNIDETRIYNRALSPAEVSALYNWAPGPVAQYSFDAGNGTAVQDISGNGNNATWGGTGSHWTQGKYGKAANFNGVDDMITLPDSVQMDARLGSLTVSSWVRTNKATQAFIYRKSQNSNTNGISIEMLSDGAAFCGYHTTVSVTSPLKYNDNKYHYISCVLDRITNIAYLYIDGTLVANSNASSIATLDMNSVGGYRSIGSSGYALFFQGHLDDLKVYNYARTQKQIVEDMNGGAPAVTNKSMVGYWKFEEGTGTTVHNTGNGGSTLDGTWNGSGSHWTPNGKFGKAGTFDGTSDYVNLGNNSSMNLASDGTVSMWINPSSSWSSYAIFFTKGGSFVNYRLQRYGSTNELEFHDGVNTLHGGTINLNQWNHIVVSFSNGIAVGYINGKQVFSGAILSSLSVNSANATIGLNSGGSAYFAGSVDEVKLYNYALTADEIKEDYNKGSAMVLGALGTSSDGKTASYSASSQYCIPGDTSLCNAPVGEWNFTEGNGTTVGDTSGNNNNGTWSGTGSHWTNGQTQKVGNFNGNSSSDYVDIPTLYNTNFPQTAATISFWIKSKISNNFFGGIFDSWDNGRNHLFIRTGDTYSYQIALQSDMSYVSVAAITNVADNKWNYITVSFDTSALKMWVYANGSLVSTSAISDPSWRPTGQISRIGRVGNTWFNGQIYGVRLYNYARSPAQVAWDYNKGGPVAQWRMNECQGTSIKDSSGNGNTGTLAVGSGGTQTQAGTCTDGNSASAWNNGANGKFGSSLNFDGTDDYVTVSNQNNFNFSSDFAISMWVKPKSNWTTGSFKCLFSKLTGAVTDGYQLCWNNLGYLYAWVGNGIAVDTNGGLSSLQQNQWYHVVAVIKQGSINSKIYINGINKSVNRSSKTAVSNTVSPVIGAKGDNTYSADALIDDVRVYNYALTPSQVQNVFNEGAAVRFGPSTGSGP